MEFTIRHIHFQVDQWLLTKEIAKILHSDGFYKYPDYDERPENMKPLNFKVTLNPSPNGGVRNDGTGTLTLPTRKAGEEFLKWLGEERSIIVGGQRTKFYPNRKQGPPHRGLLATLEKTPYIDPSIEEKRYQTLRDLDVALRINKVQFGVFYRDPNSISRKFSIEWEQSYDRCLGWLHFEYDHGLLRAELGDRMTEKIGYSIVIQFSNIVKCGIGFDFGNPYLCFELLTPPILQEEDFNRELTFDENKDSRKYRRRIGALHPGHARVAPYAHQVRILLYEAADVDLFAKLCYSAGLRKPVSAQIDAEGRRFFEPRQLHRIQLWLKAVDWSVAFQLEAILHNGLLNTEDLLTHLYEPINKLYQKHPTLASGVLRSFTEALHSSPLHETPLQCFERVRARKLSASITPLSAGMFMCAHVTFTPTRMLLEGPYPTQSNRVIRLYQGHEGHFIRVDFRDEDRLQLRWDRDVDGSSFLKERVGRILKEGFTLAGRKFEFLAYSSSALRGHQVWFMNPFIDERRGHIDSEYIRNSLGDFSGVKRFPSKYAARMAQAFTATDPSKVRLTRDQWDEMPDLGVLPYIFTDGVGTISRELGDRIWDELCQDRRDHGARAIRPSAYQIRFLGYKGVVCVDPELEGIRMRLRPSMNKFKGHEEDSAEIEIARAFERPSNSYLNRSLVMILEDLKVRFDAFRDLQNQGIARAYEIGDSIDQFCQVLRSHSLGGDYRLITTMQRLKRLNLDLKHRRPERTVDSPFLSRLCYYARNHVLRDIKHGARILIPNAYLLVGVADEGPAYTAAGRENVYVLEEGKIYACIQRPEDTEPTWLEGPCIISRSPVVHPGDVQHVYAIGKPPKDRLCLFRDLKNVVVFSSTGGRSLPSCLAGGDLDGDLYDVILEPTLLTTDQEDPAEYPATNPLPLKREGDSEVGDICDFIVEYINSDVLGLLSDRHLIIADQSKYGTRDVLCLKLAAMCSQAVDYPKNGIAVNIDNSPRFLIPYKPDWHAAEIAAPRGMDFYRSSRALGRLYRIIKEDPSVSPTSPQTILKREPLTDPISIALKPLIKRQLRPYTDPDGSSPEAELLFRKYKDEMLYISTTHTLSNAADVRLKEEEIVVGTILAKCSQRRWRKDRIYRMHVHTSILVHDIQRDLLRDPDNPTITDLRRAWEAWDYSQRNSDLDNFGAESFGLIALAVILDCLEKMGLLPDEIITKPFHRKK